MVDRDLILAKAGSVKRRLDRIIEKRGNDMALFLNDLDRQEIILFNLQMAIQECIDPNVAKVEDAADLRRRG